MITAIALDDEPLALKLISQYCSTISLLDLKKCFTNPDDAETFIAKNKVDLIFLDIQMPDINGLNFLQKLRNPPLVIFTTAYKDFAVDGFNLNAIDYILKPIEYDRFLRAVHKVKEYLEFLAVIDSNNSSLFVKVNYEMTRVNLKEIDLIEALDDYIKIHTKSNPVLTLMTLKNILDRLPKHDFLRVHRSYIVPVSKVERFNKTKIHVAGKEIPIGSSYNDVYDILMNRTKRKIS